MLTIYIFSRDVPLNGPVGECVLCSIGYKRFLRIDAGVHSHNVS